MNNESSGRPSEQKVPSESWPRIKDLFWELQKLAPHERERRLSAQTHDQLVRDYALRLLASSDAMGDRFEPPALDWLGLVGGSDNGPDGPESATLVGRMLGKYRIVRRIGQGGMGAVYEALRSDDSYDKRVAIKTLWRGADSAILLQRFRSERQILAGLEHPNIARLIDGGTTEEGTPFLVMEMVDGITIDEFCDSRALDVIARLDLFRQVCAAVHHAHQNLVIHRDLKPSNVLVTANSSVKLLDFGVAKLIDDPRTTGTLTGAGLSPFTRAYAAPEQIDGRPVSTATDVYALGALLFVLLTGKSPFHESRVSAEGVRSRTVPIPSASVSDAAAHARALPTASRLAQVLRGDLDAITLTALREDPARRYATVDALSEDVHRYLRGERVLATPDTLSYRARVFVRTRRALVATAASVAIALVSLSGIALNQTRMTRREAVRSERIAQFLTSMTGSPDTRTGSMLVRHGTRATVAEMLDSALRRVPVAFHDDPNVRARLYTAIGASYVAQSRMRDAAHVLDSATYLAGITYGTHSDEFAEANLAAAEAAMHRSPVPVAAAYARAALGAVQGREKTSPELYSRALAMTATTRFLAAEFRGADSLAQKASAAELARTPAPTLTRAWAIRLRAGVSLLRQDWIGTDSLAAHASAIADSLGDTFAFERLDALFERSEARLAMGDLRTADSLTRVGLDAAERGYGPRSRESAIFLAQMSSLARLRGDTSASHAMARSALQVIDSIPDVNPEVRIGVTIAALSDLWAHREFGAADSLAHRVLSRTVDRGDPMALATAASYAGLASVYDRQLPRAESDFRQGLKACSSHADLASLCRTLRRQLAVTVGSMGRRAEAEIIFASLPRKEADEGRSVLASNLAKPPRSSRQ